MIAGICAIALSGCSQVIGKNNADNTQAPASAEDIQKEEYVGCMPFTEVSKFIASENNADNSLEPKGDYYVRELPDGIIVANSTIQYGGKSWAQISYTNNIYSIDRMMCIYLHEIFHNNQEALGHISSIPESNDEMKIVMGYDNSHMDEMDARILIKLEWEALFKALESEGEERKKAVKAALVFREKRREIYNKASDENSFEIEEGLPDYTAFKLYYKERDKLMKALKESLVISIAVPHVMGDYAEFSIKYSDLSDYKNADNEII